MTSLHQIAHFQNRRDEVPKVELARALTSKKDRRGIAEIAENVWNKNKNIQADCVKVLYEIGALNPALIADYADDFLKLLQSKNNRLGWGGMTALAAIAELNAEGLVKHLDEITAAIEAGSVITVDNGGAALACAASVKPAHGQKIVPYLLHPLATCHPKDVPQRAEKTLPAVNAQNKAEFLAVLEKRLTDMTGAQGARVRKVMREAQKR